MAGKQAYAASPALSRHDCGTLKIRVHADMHVCVFIAHACMHVCAWQSRIHMCGCMTVYPPGATAVTTLLATLAPNDEALSENMSTLSFALRARQVMC